MSGYKITEKDIDAVMRLMKIVHPENANYDYCKGMLEFFQADLVSGLRRLALNNPDSIEGLYDKYEEYLRSKEARP